MFVTEDPIQNVGNDSPFWEKSNGSRKKEEEEKRR
jgi:hypothetical protein